MQPLELRFRTVIVGPMERSYWMPSGQPRSPAPLLIICHDHGTTGQRLAQRSPLVELATGAGFAVAFPDAMERVWDDHGSGRRDRADDAAFIRALTEHLQRRGDCGEEPPFLIGVGNGACFVEWLARATNVPIAGIALVGGTTREAARSKVRQPRVPLPVFVAVEDRPGGRRIGLRTRLALRNVSGHRQIPAAELIDDWRSVNAPAGVGVDLHPLGKLRGDWPRGAAGSELATAIVAFAAAHAPASA